MSLDPVRIHADRVQPRSWVCVALAAGALLWLRLFSNIELSMYAPFVYSIWGIVVLFYAPKMDSFWMFLGFALALRFGCVGTNFVWSDDAYRYLWEGKAVLSGYNPYTTPPASFEVLDGVREYVNHPDIPTVYPPLAQYWFALQAYIWYNPSTVQIASTVADVGTAVAIWVWLHRQGLSLKGAWVYALHPLPIIECAWSAHLESLAVCCLAWGLVVSERWRKWLWFIGGWVKLLPFVFVFCTRNWRVHSIVLMVLISFTCVYPFWDPSSLSGLQTYASHWSYNSTVFALIDIFAPSFARPLCVVIAAVSSVYVWWLWHQLHLSSHRAILWLVIIIALCSPTVHPWYALWVMVPTLMVGDKTTSMVLLLWCSLIPLTYVSIFTLNPLTGEWSPPLWPTLVSYLVPLAIWLRFQFRRVLA